MATIYSEQSAATVLAALDAGRITALPPAGSLPASTVRRCTHIVGLMGHEPIAAALDAGAGRRPGWPGPPTRHQWRHSRSGGPARRACLACREDSRMRRPVHHRPSQRRRLRPSRPHRLHRRTARPARVLHACHGSPPTCSRRERGPLPDARTVRHARHFPGHLQPHTTTGPCASKDLNSRKPARPPSSSKAARVAG